MVHCHGSDREGAPPVQVPPCRPGTIWPSPTPATSVTGPAHTNRCSPGTVTRPRPGPEPGPTADSSRVCTPTPAGGGRLHTLPARRSLVSTLSAPRPARCLSQPKGAGLRWCGMALVTCTRCNLRAWAPLALGPLLPPPPGAGSPAGGCGWVPLLAGAPPFARWAARLGPPGLAVPVPPWLRCGLSGWVYPGLLCTQ